MAAMNNPVIIVLLLVVVWFALNLSMLRDWIAEKKAKTSEVS